MSADKPISGLSMLTDSDLILRSQQGDLTAFEHLVQRYDRRVLTIAASYVSSADDAKDIYQEVFLRVYKGIRKFEHRSEFSTWLYRITTNVCLTFRARSTKRQATSIDRDSEEDDGQPHGLKESLESGDRTDEQAMRSEVSRNIRQALEALSPQQRMVFTLRHYEGYKLKEIAAMMNVSEGTVKKYLFDATARMRRQLQEHVK